MIETFEEQNLSKEIVNGQPVCAQADHVVTNDLQQTVEHFSKILTKPVGEMQSDSIIISPLTSILCNSKENLVYNIPIVTNEFNLLISNYSSKEQDNEIMMDSNGSISLEVVLHIEKLSEMQTETLPSILVEDYVFGEAKLSLGKKQSDYWWLGILGGDLVGDVFGLCCNLFYLVDGTTLFWLVNGSFFAGSEEDGFFAGEQSVQDHFIFPPFFWVLVLKHRRMSAICMTTWHCVPRSAVHVIVSRHACGLAQLVACRVQPQVRAQPSSPRARILASSHPDKSVVGVENETVEECEEGEIEGDSSLYPFNNDEERNDPLSSSVSAPGDSGSKPIVEEDFSKWVSTLELHIPYITKVGATYIIWRVAIEFIYDLSFCGLTKRIKAHNMGVLRENFYQVINYIV
ncbi:hypothetical protein MA16_Dca023713 [Dendrobium catenatum]|uniref:Uncharacterized protein n=1 Tax=Dendrobium catenatum TaxID=906689 RepID=A0A2I0XF88_9ASPA|nr:hypothetical protein MA16_Dca023713 [Dendrobium catenatum]